MSDTPSDPKVKHGDRRDEVWFEEDEDQIARVRHTFPAEGPAHEQSEASEKGLGVQPTDVAVVPEGASAWEAVEDEG